jgi:two-component system heavy metal sensor histidine kinase CusS
MKRPLSIAARLNTLFLAILAAVLVVGGTWLAAAIDGHFQEQDRMEIAGKLALLRRVAAGVRAPADLKALPQQVDDLLAGQHGVVLAVADAGGAPLFAYPSAVFPQGWEASAVARATPGDAPLLRWDRDGASYRGLVEAMPTASAALPALVVGVGLDIEHHQQFMQALRDALLPALAACLALAGLLTWLATRHGLAPLRDMAGVAKGISASRLDQRLAVDTVPRELVDLAASFNGMLGRLEDSFRRLQEFSADIAHDMRTPVSNLMMQAQVAVSRARGPEEYREVLYSAIEEYDRLARMISDMLFLARADNGQLVPGRERLDLAQEMGALCEFYEPVATERGVRLLCTGAAAAAGDRVMLRRAFANLLSNALRHTPDGGVVRIEIAPAGAEAARVAIENPGPPIPVEHLTRIFDRFYRIDPSRQKSGENAGLGLAITRSIVVAHGGRIEALPRPAGARFEVTLPT